MSKEKQIEEMAKDICLATQHTNYKCNDMCEKQGNCAYCNVMAEYLYNANNCKQSENVIELPCKAGTTLYFLYNRPYADKPDLTPRIYKTDDWHFEIDKTGIVIMTNAVHSLNKKYDYYLGEAVFLTEEEAKRALARMKGGAE